jgi:hypothetical protein
MRRNDLRTSSLSIAGLAMAVFGVGAALPACFHALKEEPERPAPPSIPVRGTPADMKTKDGAVDGYRVSRTCVKPSCVALQAEQGTRQFVNDVRSDFEQLRSSVHRSCKEVTSLFSSGAGGGCVNPGPPALLIWMYDWREVDAAIACVGGELVKAGSNDPVALCVSGHDFSIEDQD